MIEITIRLGVDDFPLRRYPDRSKIDKGSLSHQIINPFLRIKPHQKPFK
jgi:hypothetical protein